jgi:hypothetical protein
VTDHLTFGSSEAPDDASADDESMSSDSEPASIKKVKLRIPPKTNSRTATTSKKTKVPGNDKEDKTYAPAKRPRQRSESPIPSFEVDEDGHEIIPDSSVPSHRIPVSSFIYIYITH